MSLCDIFMFPSDFTDLDTKKYSIIKVNNLLLLDLKAL